MDYRFNSLIENVHISATNQVPQFIPVIQIKPEEEWMFVEGSGPPSLVPEDLCSIRFLLLSDVSQDSAYFLLFSAIH